MVYIQLTPKKEPNAKRYKTLTFREALVKQLKVMDSTAFSLCMDNNMPIQVFDVNKEGNLRRAIAGEDIGTLISSEEETQYYG